MKADGCGWGVSDVRVIRSCIKAGAFSSILLSFQAFRHHDLHFARMGKNDMFSKPTYPQVRQAKNLVQVWKFLGGRGGGRAFCIVA